MRCAGNVHNAARSIYGFGAQGLMFDLKNTKHLVLYGRNIIESLHRRSFGAAALALQPTRSPGGIMKAVTVQPGVAGSVRFEEVPEPDESTGSILVEAVAVGI